MESLVATRTSLHAVAEQVLAGDLHRRTGRIGLRRTAGGFGQPELLIDGRRWRLRLQLDRLVVLDGDVETWHPLTTLEAVAASAGTVAAPPVGVYEPQTSLSAGDPLVVDPAAARRLAAVFAFGESVIEEFRARFAASGPSLLQLWPEHFDLACSASEVNYGISPGDAGHPEPYLYVGPWTVPKGPDCNETWGRSLPWNVSRSESTALQFLESGRTDATA